MKVRVELSPVPLAARFLPTPSGGNHARRARAESAVVTSGHRLANEPDSGLTREVWNFVRRHSVKILALTLMGALLGMAFHLWRTPVYQAVVTLEIQDLNEDFLSLKEMLPVSQGSPAATPGNIQTQVRILRSSSLLGSVLDKHPTRASDRAEALERAQDSLQVRESRQAKIVDVLFDSPDPRYAADFLNTLAQEYIQQNVEARWKMSQNTSEWLTRQLDEMRGKLEASEAAMQAYVRRSGLLFASEKHDFSEARLLQVQDALSKAEADRMAKQARLESVQKPVLEALPGVLEDATLRDYQAKLTDLRRQRAELSTVFKPSFDGVTRLDAQIAIIEAALKEERAAILKRIRSEYEDAGRRENLLQASFANHSRQVLLDAEKAIQYGVLKREVDGNRQLYDAMLHRVKEASLASAIRASNVRVVDPAVPPRTPYAPNLRLNLLWGLTSGLLAGMMLAVVLERCDRSIQGPGDLNHYLSVPELGSAPWANGSRAVDSFRAIATSVLFSDSSGKVPQVVVVTSAQPLEGKTTVAGNLAAALARIHRRVLLIDCDLHRSRLHEVFGVSSDYGLADVLSLPGPECRELLPYVVQSTSVPGLFLLSGGPPASNAADLLYSARMAELLAQARRSFDTVIIDTPPMLELPDARVLGRMSDGVVLVVRAGVTTRDVVLAAKQRLIGDGSALLGTVLNDWPTA